MRKRKRRSILNEFYVSGELVAPAGNLSALGTHAATSLPNCGIAENLALGLLFASAAFTLRFD
jgi:hypothetical protein